MERRVAVIVSSDSGYEGKREDQSGPEICRIAEEHGYRVVSFVILPDDQEKLTAEMERIADERLADLILTTGGTGFSPRDCMPEATLAAVEREVPGIPEAMPGPQPAVHQTRHAQQKCGGNTEADIDCQSAGQSQSSPGMSGVCNHRTGSRAGRTDRKCVKLWSPGRFQGRSWQSASVKKEELPKKYP